VTRSALVVRGGWSGHSPVETTDLFIPYLERNGFTVDVADSPEPFADEALMAGTDLIVLCFTMGTIEPKQANGLSAAVRAGTGLAGWHGGIVDAFRGSLTYLHLLGAQFVAHPAKPPEELVVPDVAENYFRTHRVAIRPEAATHPIVDGIEDFELTTEHYWVVTDAYLDVLATTTMPARDGDPWNRPVTMPAIWTRNWGAGRVMVATPGHDVGVLRHPSVKTVIERGMLWASR